MVIAPAFSTAFLPPEADRETTINARPPPTPKPSIRPMTGLLALSEHPGGVMAVTTLGTVLSRDCRGRPRYVLVTICETFVTTLTAPSADRAAPG